MYAHNEDAIVKMRLQKVFIPFLLTPDICDYEKRNARTPLLDKKLKIL